MGIDPSQLLIRASAGAGKTYRLTHHYLDLLRHGASVESILATTFTRKAAGEILGRLVRTLCDEAEAGVAASAQLKSSAALLDEVAGNLHRVGVATIDGFFHRLGNGFRFELDLPLEPRLIEEGSAEAAALRAESIEAVLFEAATDDQAFGALLDLLRRLHHDSAARSVTRAIDDIVVTHAGVFREAPWEEVWTTLRPEGLLDRAGIEQATERWIGLEAYLPTTKAGKPRSHWVNSWRRTLECVQQQDWDGLVASGLLAKVFVGEEMFDRTPIDGDWLDVSQAWCMHARAVLLERIARQTAATHELMRRFSVVYEQLRAQRGVMLYSDMAHRLAGGLFAGRTVSDEQALAEIYFRLDAAVTHLLLDEFQDTSLDQWQVLSPFVDEIGATGDGTRSLFVVGDTKQAIYAWRGGCVELFDSVEHHAPLIERESLAKSYRSSQTVLDVVNDVFSDLASCNTLNHAKHPEDADAAAAWSAGFDRHEAAHADLSGFVSFESSPVAAEPTADDADDGMPDSPDAAFAPADSHEAFVAQRIGELHRQLNAPGSAPGSASGGASGGAPGPRRTIGVLTRGNKMVNRLLYELRRAGLPASGEGGNPIADTPAVAAAISAVRLSDHPGDTAAAFHVLNSPIGEVLGMASRRDAGRVALNIREAVLRDGWAATVAHWVAALAPACDAAGLAKLSKLVELAEQYESSNITASAQALRGAVFAEFIEGAKVEEPSASPIRVMTIHRSKGLEFDAVVLPELDGRFNNNFEVLIDRPDPTGPVEGVFRGVKEANRSIDPALVRAYTRQRARQRQEDLCTLYVAMTRAKRGLHLIAKPAIKPDGKPRSVGLCFAGILRDTLGDPDGGPITRGDADWVGPDLAPITGSGEVTADALTPAVLSVKLDHKRPARRMRPTVSPSQLHGPGKVSVDELLSFESRDARQRGTDLHALLERVDYLDGERPPDESLPGLRTIFGHAQVRRAFTRRYGEPERLWAERSFVVPDGKRLLKGKFDRVVFAVDESGRATAAHLIDFKTDRVAAGSVLLTQRVEQYRAQIEAYRRALSLMLKLDEPSITAELLFTSPGVSIAV